MMLWRESSGAEGELPLDGGGVKWCRIVLLFFFLLFLTSPLGAVTERILDFSTMVLVDPDGSLTVEEQITVQATGDQIKRGIVREFPTIYTDKNGRGVRVGFQLLSVRRDGQDEPYHTENRSNGIAIYAGQKNVFLQPGRYSYTLIYKTTRQLGFFSDHDELYWNVTGNGWRLPMDQVRCEVQLPGDAKALDVVSYEGPQGSTEGRRFSGGENRIQLASSRPYASGEGLTIAVSWPKGFVTAPSKAEEARNLLLDSGPLVPAAVGGAVLLLYYFLAWLRVGKDPAKGVVIPLYAPPQNFSPAMLRTLDRMGYDNNAFSCALVNMAVKRALRIEDEGKTKLIFKPEVKSGLSGDELLAFEALSAAGKSLVVERANHGVLRKAREAMKDALTKNLASTYFRANSGWLAPGIVITLLTVAGIGIMSPIPPVVLFMSVWLTGWTFGCFTLVRQAWRAWQMRGLRGKTGALFLSLFALPFVGGELAGIGVFMTQTSLPAAGVFLAMLLCNGLFYELLKAPTVIGRRIMDEIEGFKLYLTVAEEDRLNLLHPPEETPELFEKFLPYAMALGVENEWGERFAAILERAGYSPQWYHGAHWNRLQPGGFASGFGSSFASNISSASTAPGSSSGMSGGSSGGGGGGGGGGGW